MKGNFLLPSVNKANVDRNIYADKSALVLEWILLKGIEKEYFSLREVVDATGVGSGTVHRVFEFLILKGYLQTIGIRTSKKFVLKNPARLFSEWLENYSIVKKCKMFSYSTGFQTREQLINALLNSGGLEQNVVLTLHSAAEAHGFKNTNLQQIELYFLQSNIKPALEKVLKLNPKERGYDV